MADESQSVSIGEFEHVAVGPSVVLLRINGRSSHPRPNPDWRPALIVDHGSGPERVEALPSPPEAEGVLRAAYSVPAGHVASGTRFWLELGDQQRVELPAPSPGAARRPAREDEPAAAEPDRVVTLTAALTEARHRVAQLENENRTMSATLEELEIWRGELERRLADTTTDLAETRARLAEAHAAAELEALVARAEADVLEQAARELTEAAARARLTR